MRGRKAEPQGEGAPPRWTGRPVIAALIRFAVLLVPIVSGVVVGAALARATQRPSGLALVPWILAVLTASTLTVTVVDRVARRLLPLATLLKLSLAFPDRVPSRFRLARQAGNVRVLERRILEARERGLEDDPARAAEAILTLVAALSAHDRKTRGHSERVRAFTDMLADEFDLSPSDRDRLRWAALLHDVGKLEVPSKTLNKPGKPTEAEWARLRRHPLEGERIATPLLPWLGPWAAVIGQHHERWDGGGYPRNLSGEGICLGARIVTVADSFEVMTAARSYKRAMTPSAARRDLQRCAGDQFDPQVVRAFLNISLGRLWWAVGPASWVAQIPFMLGIGRTGGRAITVARAATAFAINGLAGILALGVGIAVAAPGQHVHTSVTVAASAMTSADVDAGGSGSGDDGGIQGDEDEGADDEGADDEPAPGDEGSEVDSVDADDSDPGNGVIDGPDDTVDDVTETVEETVDDVTDTITETVDDVTETVEETVDDVAETVEETADDVTDTVDDVLDGAPDPLG